MISILNFTILLGGKYLLRKAFGRSFQVVNELDTSFYNQSLALSLSEKGKSLSHMVSVDTLLNFMVSHFAINLQRCLLGLSKGRPLN